MFFNLVISYLCPKALVFFNVILDTDVDIMSNNLIIP